MRTNSPDWQKGYQSLCETTAGSPRSFAKDGLRLISGFGKISEQRINFQFIWRNYFRHPMLGLPQFLCSDPQGWSHRIICVFVLSNMCLLLIVLLVLLFIVYESSTFAQSSFPWSFETEINLMSLWIRAKNRRNEQCHRARVIRRLHDKMCLPFYLTRQWAKPHVKIQWRN